MEKFGGNGKNIPVTVTVATETEPTAVDGVFSRTADGFTLEFCIGEDKFVISHTNEQTTVKTKGLMSYEITLCDVDTQTVLATPFGMVKFDVKTELRKVEEKDNSLHVMLLYVLHADGVGDMNRSVDIIIRNSEL
ncbi:MAG: DUF1934 family protein [Clostridiales bacterium]|nr:DUF1934 family protein [Clostridiales bacterium]